MIISGDFRDIKDRLVTVTITTSNDVGQEIVIGEDDYINFNGDPVHIELSAESSFDIILQKSSTISLNIKQYLGDYLFAANARSITVVINRGNEVLFSGYLDPNTYNQPFSLPVDVFELNCIDKLSTLKYYNYKDVDIDNYENLKSYTGNVTFKSILDDCFGDLTFDHIYYDLSKGLTQAHPETVFDDLEISDLSFFGEDFDDIKTKDEVLQEILKYLNLHVRQEGNDIFIYDNASIRRENRFWYDLISEETFSISGINYEDLNGKHADDKTNITIKDVYNQIQLTCNLETQDTVIESPLSKDSLDSQFNGKQLYMTEYSSEGSGDDARDALEDMVNGRPTTYEEAKEFDWYLQALYSKSWNLYYADGSNVLDLAEKTGNKFVNQWKIAKYLREHSCVPYIFKMGSVERQSKATDNSPISKIDMKPYLYISINGNEIDTSTGFQPSDTVIESHNPVLEYISPNSGGCFSPIDDDTINYLVFSGELLLQPISYESSSDVATKTNNFQDILTNGCRKTEGSDAQVPNYDGNIYIVSNLVKSENNGEGRYYTRKFWTQENWNDEPTTYLTNGQPSLQPWTKDLSARGYEYSYSQRGDSTDLYSKLAVIECELIIGNKRLIEINMDEYGNSDFVWVEIGQEPTETYEGVTYPITTFSLGVNPKIGDYIIGQSYKLQNNIDYTMNIEAEGTAIPIKKSDAVSGPVLFRILGPVNSIWNQITRRHPSFWRHTRWYENTKSVLAHTENIIIKDFECKLYTDSGKQETFGDNDLIYMSDEQRDYINKNDDTEFDFVTQLTTEEFIEKGIKPQILINAVMHNGIPISKIYNVYETDNTKKMAKAEEHYVNQYYLEYYRPRIQMNINIKDTYYNWLNIYYSVPLTRRFYIFNANYDVRKCNVDCEFYENF